MRLTRKLTLALILATCAVLAVYAYLGMSAEIDAFERQMVRDHRAMGRAMAVSVAEAWKGGGEPLARELIARTNERESAIDIKWVWLDGTAEADRPAAPSHATAPSMAGHPSTWVDHQRGDHGHLYSYIPVPIDGGRPGAVEISESLDEQQSHVRKVVVRTAAATLLVVVACTLLTMGLGALLVGRPIGRLITMTRKIAAGDLSARLHLTQGDELRDLAEAMNSMCERLEDAQTRAAEEANERIATIEQLRHADRLRTVGRLASGVAHELGTPLNVVGLRARMIEDGETEDLTPAASARIIRLQSERMTQIIRQLLDFARLRAPKKVVADLRALVRQTVAMLGPAARSSGVTLELVDGPPVPALIESAQIEQVLANLVMNAIQAGADRITISIGRKFTGPSHDASGDIGPYAFVSVRDTGSGMPEETRNQLFTPFFTTKKVGEGTGLGLAVSHGIVREHGGWFAVDSAEGQGSCFTFYLQASEEGVRVRTPQA